MQDSRDIEIVSNRLKEFGLECVKFTTEEMNGRKTPDRMVLKNGNLAFYLEVKRLDQTELSDFDGRNRLSRRIHRAVKQFESVNPDSTYPNVLAFLNENDCLNSGDIDFLLTGFSYRKHGVLYTLYPHGPRRDRIEREMSHIDLILWIDINSRQSTEMMRMFNVNNPGTHLDLLCSYFNVDPDSVRREFYSRFE